jgi:hypothetical protein
MSRAEFGAALRKRLNEMDRSQEWLGAEAARLEGREKPYIQQTVGHWINGTAEPSPPATFAIEKALQLRAGTLSRALGYLPPDSRSATTVKDAVAADPKLTASGRRILAKVYEELVDGAAGGE